MHDVAPVRLNHRRFWLNICWHSPPTQTPLRSAHRSWPTPASRMKTTTSLALMPHRQRGLLAHRQLTLRRQRRRSHLLPQHHSSRLRHRDPDLRVLMSRRHRVCRLSQLSLRLDLGLSQLHLSPRPARLAAADPAHQPPTRRRRPHPVSASSSRVHRAAVRRL